MALYSYKKSPAQIIPKKSATNNNTNNSNRTHSNAERSDSSHSSAITVGDILSGLYLAFHRLMIGSQIAALIVPSILIITGGFIVYRQVWPTVSQTVQEALGVFDTQATTLVAGEYTNIGLSYSNPGSRYFAELKNNAQDQNLLFNDEKSATYKNNFRLSIPSLGLNGIKVSANVDSGVEEVYDRVLTDGLAHFQGTSLPVSDSRSQNIVVYGHSSAGDYYERTKDPAASFSRLSDIRYGAEIIINIDGKEYKYRFVKAKTVDANDLSILEGTPGQKILTLFTCYPNGNNAKRFVATARLIE